MKFHNLKSAVEIYPSICHSLCMKRKDFREICRRAFGALIKSRRNNDGLNQEEFAEEAGLERSYVSALETGRNHPGLDTILQCTMPLRRVVLQELWAEYEVLLRKEIREAGLTWEEYWTGFQELVKSERDERKLKAQKRRKQKVRKKKSGEDKS